MELDFIEVCQKGDINSVKKVFSNFIINDDSLHAGLTAACEFNQTTIILFLTSNGVSITKDDYEKITDPDKKQYVYKLISEQLMRKFLGTDTKKAKND